MEYKIVTCLAAWSCGDEASKKMEKEVNKLINEGFEPYGPLSVTSSGLTNMAGATIVGQIIYNQTMIRK